MHLYLRETPRALFLVTSSEDERQGAPSRALVFRATDEGSQAAQAVVEFVPKSEVDLTGVVRPTSRQVKGCLGLIHIAPNGKRYIFLAVVTSASELGNICPSARTPEKVCKIHEVAFFCLTSSVYDELSAPEGLASPDFQADNVMREQYAATNNPQAQIYEHPCAPLTKILSSGSFYYAPNPHWDISTRLAERIKRIKSIGNDLGAFDERFVWNEYIVRSLLDFRERLDPQERVELDKCQFIILAIQGFVGIFTIPLPNVPKAGGPSIGTLAMISRLGWRRAGTRFNTRGVDDDGNCANFVETEVIFNTDTFCYSYVQVRGSVPLFWEQQGFQTFGHKIQITRPQAASQPAFDRHFAQLVDQYSAVHAVNLLGSKENETSLTTAYAQHLRAGKTAGGDAIGFTNFDFHATVRALGHDSVPREVIRIPDLHRDTDKFAWTTCDLSTDEVITSQQGVFRTNCLDCLDRTNFIQDILSKYMLEQYLRGINDQWATSFSLWTSHREMWAENGDALSRIYAGTGALNTSFTRSGKRTLAGVLSDATKSVSRAYINNFQDKAKQAAIDMFLGNMTRQVPVTIFDPIHDSVRVALNQRLAEYSTTEPKTIFIGTWNLNGRPPSESLLPWLFPGTTHLAAGHANLEERNSDYRTIANGLHFLRGKTIGSHENVIWLADTNYRIDMDNESVRTLVKAVNFDALVAADQLKQAMDARAAFVGFEEGPLLFPPTYRYDVGTDNYDTSEKMRIPAWTDRILYRGTLDLAKYSRAELKGSDHRPVFAIFRSTVRIIDHAKRDALSKKLLESVASTAPGDKLDEKLEKLTISDAIHHIELPPPSSEDSVWWDQPDHPDGEIPLRLITDRSSGNPFEEESDESSNGSSPSSSDDELYNHAQKLQPPLIPTKSPPHTQPQPRSIVNKGA
ncbi:hypothetical protein M422DRAFT_211433 [Sphaerobolus stellatus SS14]|uniref:phosphoinositide 5-phosphatase n=1 Tax=Sphaerobolus stellatus (strain SS14) TaxID=990650 RepID=A0A0C9VJ92_SPHS4|nr:hypothetical protein M422DRAFT_211433 [Sphaerobolus stellatus SS14]